MERPEFYILRGREPVPATMMEWAQWFRNFDNRKVAVTMIGSIKVSTVCLGNDHQHDPDGPPLIFETMIFGGEYDAEGWRCSTYDEAEALHERACALVRGGMH